MSTLFFDTETTGLWQFKNRTLNPTQPNLVQLSARLCDEDRKEVTSFTTLVAPKDYWKVESGAQGVHGISIDRMRTYGSTLEAVIAIFDDMLVAADVVVAHNIKFDMNILRKAYGVYCPHLPTEPFEDKDIRCTMMTSTPILKLPKKKGAGAKWPKLEECMAFFFKEGIVGAHDAAADTEACMRVYWHLLDNGHFDGAT